MPVPPEFARSGPAPLALVTGAARRIGAALATTLARDGFRVALHYHRSQAEAEELAARLTAEGCPPPLCVGADLTDPQAVAGLIDALPEAPVVLVNNASLFEEDGLADFTLERWERQLAVNLRAPAQLTQAFARRLPQGAAGLIVNLSDAKLAFPNPDFFTYTVSKGGLAWLTELAARALAPSIRVNAIAPAVTLVSGAQSRANFAQAHVRNALRRGVDVEHLAGALRYLVATPTVTGQTLVVDAGQRFLGLTRDVAYVVEERT
ncbi:MAG: SDR family oxidoreductase [Sphingomonadaceae bacterium]|uniref:SDR family oxidoreductase n=1 Tax=Thermaurantiacus sp. TaxID=2820283 RepID=UPI00298F3CCE|nr:SDR family oxidoreductase [Thermaurantiacus sp.]MCS6986788.1 SDR family oxidoreductase [Sphingomonadaceae bacterium]MDW8413949.1 SDR family oxidoreductase [Thermaurantiacus sp.]